MQMVCGLMIAHADDPVFERFVRRRDGAADTGKRLDRQAGRDAVGKGDRGFQMIRLDPEQIRHHWAEMHF